MKQNAFEIREEPITLFQMNLERGILLDVVRYLIMLVCREKNGFHDEMSFAGLKTTLAHHCLRHFELPIIGFQDRPAEFSARGK